MCKVEEPKVSEDKKIDITLMFQENPHTITRQSQFK